ncbi:MAG TPA: MFS transporter, partial [Stellaceae bacterium]|nr:MFS transporter [Stellaceae bacterium]
MSVQVSDRRKPFVIGAIIVSTFMVAVEQTIVATAMPSIVSQLGGFSHYSWVFAAYLVPQTATTVIWGKFADMIGRKPVLVLGLLVFLLGSALCGMAGSMEALIFYRVLQGIGAGAIQPITMTVVGDLYRMEERTKIQAFTAGTWMVASVIGPLLGGLIIKFLPWAWIFWLNLPVGVIPIIGFMATLKEKVEKKRSSIDYPGAVLFIVSTVALLFLLGEPEQPWAVLGACAVLFLGGGAAFIWWEGRAPDPIISIALWARRLIATCNGVTVLIGMVLFGLNVMMPIYLQGVLGRTPVQAGLTLTALVAGWPIAVMQARFLFPAFGIANVMRAGGIVIFLGALGLIFLTPESSSLTATFYTLVISLGMGWSGFTAILMTQESVEWSMRGRATAANIFS